MVCAFLLQKIRRCELMTEDERKQAIKKVLPDTVDEMTRPTDSVPTDFPLSTDFPQLFKHDPVSADVFNLINRQMLSNDKQLQNNLTAHNSDTAAHTDIRNNIQTLADSKADMTYVDQKVADLVNGAPEQLDTLQELSKALNNDKDFAVTVTNALAKKLDTTANAVSASKLATPRIISLSGKAAGSVTFDGSDNATLNVTSVTADTSTGNAETATKLATARTISLTGKATGSASFDGSANASINVTAVTADSCTGNSATASAVAWTGITGKPSTYTPATHNHDTSYPSISGSRATGTWGINVTGTSANVTQKKSATAVTHTDYNNNQTYLPDMSFLSYWNGAFNSSNSSNLKYCANGTIIGSNNISSQSVKYATSAGTATTATTANAVAWDNVTEKCVEHYSFTSKTNGNLKLGQLTIPQVGYFAEIIVRTGRYYNAYDNQNATARLYIRTANGVGTYSAYAIWDKFTTYKFHIVKESSSTSSTTVLSIYLTNVVYTGNSFYEIRYTKGCSYINQCTSESSLPDGYTPTNYQVAYTTDIPSDFPTKTGTGASGTWGISISGNAATATTATTANAVAWDNVTGKPSDYVSSYQVDTGQQHSTETGYIKYNSGIMIQWGQASIAAGDISFVQTLPVSFCNNVFLTFGNFHGVSGHLTNSSSSVELYIHLNEAQEYDTTVDWLAIGSWK